MAVVSRDSFRGRQTVSAELAQIRVLTVDNHALVREGIAVVLDSESYMRVMAEASKMAVEIAEHQAGDALTDLEVQVLKEVADGDANKIVADRLAI
jgi:DNA-binding NarL/FixJ family response regulator